MGLAAGKLTLHQVDDKSAGKTEANAEPNQNSHAKETASQLVNGDANAVSNVPPIDEELEPTLDKSATESQPQATDSAETVPETVAEGDQVVSEPNESGKPEPQETEQKKKRKNPLVWIKRRLSKKSNTVKHTSDEAGTANVDEPANDPSVPEPEAPKPTETETASSLVQEVLTSAAAVQEERKNELVEPEPPVKTVEPSEVVAEAPAVESHTEVEELPVSPCQPVEAAELTEESPPVELLNGNHMNEETEEKDLVKEYPIVDSNNTNVHENGTHTPDEVHDFDLPHQPTDAMAAKLAGLDVSNCHSEHTHLNGNADTCEVTETNGVLNVD